MVNYNNIYTVKHHGELLQHIYGQTPWLIITTYLRSNTMVNYNNIYTVKHHGEL